MAAFLWARRPIVDELKRLQEANYPFVYIGRREVPDSQINWVINDYRKGSAEATQHLLDLGHRHLAFTSGRIENEAQIDKYDGCKDAIEAVEGAKLHTMLHDTISSQERLLQAIKQHQITALIVEQEASFHRILAMLSDAAIRIPEEISILSLTTAEHSLPYALNPTHLNLERRNVGAQAVKVLIDLMNSVLEHPQQVHMPTALVIGETTGPCPH